MKCGYSANTLKAMGPDQLGRSPPFVIATEKDLRNSCNRWEQESGILISSLMWQLQGSFLHSSSQMPFLTIAVIKGASPQDEACAEEDSAVERNLSCTNATRPFVSSPSDSWELLQLTSMMPGLDIRQEKANVAACEPVVELSRMLPSSLYETSSAGSSVRRPHRNRETTQAIAKVALQKLMARPYC